jgi:autotransporter-associated beta strand protein
MYTGLLSRLFFGGRRLPLLATIWSLACFHSFAISVSNYVSAVNDRFTSGFPTAPVQNTNASFIGAGEDWSGVGWSTATYASSTYKGFGMLSPMHFLTAQHYEYGAELTTGVRILGQDGTVYTQTNSSISNLGYGLRLANAGQTNYDLAIGTLRSSITSPKNMARLAVLDLHSSSTADSLTSYNSLSMMLYGRNPLSSSGSPRAGGASAELVTAFNSDPKQMAIRTTQSTVSLQTGDSGSPALNTWTNPDGKKELTVLGLNSATGGGYNYVSLLANAGAINAANAVMNDDGYALRVVGNPYATWAGGNGTAATKDDLARSGNWSGSVLPTDKFVLFNADTSSYKAIDVNTATTLRGLYFKSTITANDGFTFGGAGTLTLERGGVVNYDSDRQTFNAPLALNDAQYWDGGSGGITVAGTLNTAGKLLEITGSGTNRITGRISGAGGLALSGGHLELTSSNTYSGTTWVHAGTLLVNNTTGSGTGSGTVYVASGGVLAGSGALNGSAVISGSVSPGNSIGTLTAFSDVTWNSGDGWLFELLTAGTSLDQAKLGSSSQDMLAIGSRFLKGSGTSWEFDFAETGQIGWYRLITWDTASGTTFSATDFTASNLTGDYTGSFSIDDGGLYIHVVPEPAVMSLVALTGLIALAVRMWRRFF